MQSKEMPRPTLEIAGPQKTPEKPWFSRLGTAIGDTIRDVSTASDMAKDHFDGDSALLRVARGGMTVAIGLGLEKAMDDTWKRAFAGKIKIFNRPELTIDPKAVKKLEGIGLNRGKAGSSFYYLVREGTKDLMVGLLYNGLAFFSRPMLPSVEGKHLVGSAVVNAVESLLEYPKNIQSDIYDIKDLRGDATDVARRPDDLKRVEGWTARNALLALLRGSNPATQLGLGMMKDGWDRFRENLRMVQQVRRERGGLPGKKVFMPKAERSQQPWKDRRYEKKEKVYYGRGNWQQQQQEEREALEKFG